MIQTERYSRDAAGGTVADDFRSIIVPAEMLAPVLSTRVEERNLKAGSGVNCGCVSPLELNSLQRRQESQRLFSVVFPPEAKGTRSSSSIGIPIKASVDKQ